MAFIASTSFFLLNENKKNENVKRKRLRDSSNPLELPENMFIEFFRINKDGFLWILERIAPRYQSTSVPISVELAATLRFFAEGSFQRSVGNDAFIALHRTTFSKCFKKMLILLEQVLCNEWIKLPTNSEEILKSKKHFYDKFGIPGVIGCIDGTHVKIVRPGTQDYLFFNRKGYYSINALIISDYRMNIVAVDATRPGSCHDSFVWSLSIARDFYSSRYENGEHGWLLADSGYALEPFVLTPYRDPSAGSAEHRFNKMHASGRNIIERTIGVCKSRFRCLYKALWYKPPKVVKIINICSALHNMCNYYKIEALNIVGETIAEESDDEFDESTNTSRNEVGRVRDSIAQSLV